MAKKTPEQKAAEEKRYIAACGAANAAELEPFLTDPNQGIRATAAMNPDADAQILDRFADDRSHSAQTAGAPPAQTRRGASRSA